MDHFLVPNPARVRVVRRETLADQPHLLAHRCRANSVHIRRSRPDSGLGFLAEVLKTFQFIPSSLGSGCSLICCELTRRGREHALSWRFCFGIASVGVRTFRSCRYWKRSLSCHGTVAASHEPSASVAGHMQYDILLPDKERRASCLCARVLIYKLRGWCLSGLSLSLAGDKKYGPFVCRHVGHLAMHEIRQCIGRCRWQGTWRTADPW